MQEIYLVPEAAEKLRVDKRIIQKLCRDGEIRAFKQGKEWRIPEESLNEYIERMLRESSR